MNKIFAILIVAVCAIACNNSSASHEDTSAFDAAYPELYSSLNLPEFRRGSLTDVSGSDLGVKNQHTILIMTDDSPSYVRDFIHPEMAKLGWRDLNARKRLSEISEDDLYFASYVKGPNKYDVNAAATNSGQTKIRITLSVFNEN